MVIYFYDAYNGDSYDPTGEDGNWTFETGINRIYTELSNQDKYPDLVLEKTSSTMLIGFNDGRTEKIKLQVTYDNSRIYLYMFLLDDAGLTDLAHVDSYSTAIGFNIERLNNNGIIVGLSTYRENAQYADNYGKFYCAFIDGTDKVTVCASDISNNDLIVKSIYGKSTLPINSNNYLRINTSENHAIQIIKAFDPIHIAFIEDLYFQTIGENIKFKYALSTCKIGEKYYYLWNETSYNSSSVMIVALECTDKITT